MKTKILMLTPCLAAALLCCDCPGAETNEVQRQPEKSAATLKYWEDLNQSFCKGDGIEMLQLPSNTEGATVAEFAEVLRDVAAVERSRCDAASRLPMLHVDSDLTLYAGEMVNVRLKAADLLSDLADAFDKQSQIASGEHLGVEFGLNFLKHLDDKEGMLWNAAKDQARETAGEIEEMKPVWNSLQVEARDFAKAASDFKSQEMKERATLTQRYEREFPLHADYAKRAVAKKPEFAMTEKQIRNLMLGHRIDTGELFNGWTFDDEREFVSLKILKSTKLNEATISCEIKTHVRGINSGQEHDFHLQIVVGRLATRCRLVSISTLP